MINLLPFFHRKKKIVDVLERIINEPCPKCHSYETEPTSICPDGLHRVPGKHCKKCGTAWRKDTNGRLVAYLAYPI